MKLPRTHTIGEVDVEVIPTDDSAMQDAGAEAMYSSSSGKPVIRMKKGLRGNYRHFCQLHEFGHAVIDMAEITLDEETEERLVGAFAAATLRLLKDTLVVNGLQPKKKRVTLLSDSKET